jgi:peptidoglycan/xylan/chitin deacetylase (PgdA/CDA1 family)
MISLMYHQVVEAGQPAGNLKLPQDVFERQLSWMLREGYEFVNAQDFRENLMAMDGKRRVLITFDDGDKSIFEYAWPVLRELGIPSLQFVITGNIGNSRHLSWRELEEMAASPWIQVASHSHTHQRFDLSRSSRIEILKQWGQDLEASATLLNRLGEAAVMDQLAWPWGYANHGMRQTALELGYTIQHLAYPGRASVVKDALALPRIRIDGEDCERYQEKLRFWWGPFSEIITTLRHSYQNFKLG